MPAVMRDSWIRAYKSPEIISRAIPDCFFPNGTGSSARQQSRPDAIFVSSIPGRRAHFDPSKISPQDRAFTLLN
eukprot:1140046-Pelagomonas_calceolata.AAC.5